MLVVARQLQPAEVEGLRQLFENLDEDATGTISLQQLQAALRHMGREVSRAGDVAELLASWACLACLRKPCLQPGAQESPAPCLPACCLAGGRCGAA